MSQIKRLTAGIVYLFLFVFACCSLTEAAAKNKTLIYIPLDNRPVTASYPVDVVRAAGYTVLTPPQKLLSSYNRNGNPEKLWQWLLANSENAEAAILSSDSLIYGGLVGSRTHQLSEKELDKYLNRFANLRDYTRMRLYVFSTLMRTPRSSVGAVEPPYYEKYGPIIFEYSALVDQENIRPLSFHDALVKQGLKEQLPPEVLKDWQTRRQKNYQTNLTLTKLQRQHKFYFLAIGKDDNAPLSATHMEARKLQTATNDLTQQTMQIVSGVDQLGLLLLTRAICDIERITPHIYVDYGEGYGRFTLPQYSDQRLAQSVPQQIMAANAIPLVSMQDADFVLAIKTPADGIMRDSTDSSNKFFSSPQDRRFIKRLLQIYQQGHTLSLADVTYSNGADNGFMNEFAKQGGLNKLLAYNAWNTADNTIGYAIAQGILARHISSIDRERLLNIRLVDDWFYQANARTAACEYLLKKHNPQAEYSLNRHQHDIVELSERVCRKLADKYDHTRYFDFELAFPWNRLFEVNVQTKH